MCFFWKISECEEEARRGNLTAESLRTVSVNNWFYSMVNKSLEYWPEDEAVVSSMLETVGDLSLDEEGVVEGSRINLRDFSILGDYMKSHAHLGLDMPLYKSTSIAGLRLVASLVFPPYPQDR